MLGYFGVSIIRRTRTWTTGSLTCVCGLFACVYTRGTSVFSFIRGIFLQCLKNILTPGKSRSERKDEHVTVTHPCGITVLFGVWKKSVQSVLKTYAVCTVLFSSSYPSHFYFLTLRYFATKRVTPMCTATRQITNKSCIPWTFRYPFHPRVTAVARKRPRSFCQKRRWQVTAKHAYTLLMW